MLAAVRDVAIVLLALLSIVIGILLAVLLVQIRHLIRMLREEIAPILQTTQGTIKRVDGTVHLVSDTVVKPLIKVNSFATGVRTSIDNLFFLKQRVSRGRRSTGSANSTPAE